jgi:hypothetical protein
MKRCSGFLGFFLLLIVIASCVEEEEKSFVFKKYEYDFNESFHGWEFGFSGLPADKDSIYTECKHTPQPTDLTAEKNSIMIASSNPGSTVFMFLKKKLINLEPNAEYTVTFEIELASNLKAGTSSDGLLQSESVYLKAGATGTEPMSVVDGNEYRMNIDKGNQNESGSDMIVISGIAAASNAEYTIIRRSNSFSTSPLVVRTNELGEIWLIIGIDSSYKGITTIYYTKIVAFFGRFN